MGVGLELGESDAVGVPDGVCVCDAVTLGVVLAETLAVEVVDGEVLIVGVTDTVELADAEAPCDSEAVGEELGVVVELGDAEEPREMLAVGVNEGVDDSEEPGAGVPEGDGDADGGT